MRVRLTRHCRNRIRKYRKHGITPQAVIEAVQFGERTFDSRGDLNALVSTDLGAFRAIFTVEGDEVVVKTVVPLWAVRF